MGGRRGEPSPEADERQRVGFLSKVTSACLSAALSFVWALLTALHAVLASTFSFLGNPSIQAFGVDSEDAL